MTIASLVDIEAEPDFEHLLDIRISFDPVQIFETPVGTRFTYVVKEGRCEGPKIAGDILPGGGDWILLGTDQVARLDVRATLRTDDGAHVHLTNTGRDADESRCRPAILGRRIHPPRRDVRALQPTVRDR